MPARRGLDRQIGEQRHRHREHCLPHGRDDLRVVRRQFTISALYYAPGCKSVPSLAQRAPSSVTLRFAQGKPSVHPRLISFATLTAGLRSIFALSCFVRPPNSQPLTTFILSTFPHQQRWSHLIFHSVQILLNKPRRAYIFATFHSAILLMELNSLQFRWPLFFVALPRLTNGGSVSSGCADGEVIARCGGTPSLVPRSWQVSRIRRSFQSKIHKFMNSQVNMGKPSEIGGESASASTRTALRALKHVISSAPRRLTESEVALLRQSKREVAHRVKQLVHSEG